MQDFDIFPSPFFKKWSPFKMLEEKQADIFDKHRSQLATGILGVGGAAAQSTRDLYFLVTLCPFNHCLK